MRRRAWLIGALLLAAVPLGSDAALACKCALVQRAQVVAATPVVFEGEIVAVKAAGAGRQLTALRVTQAIKGTTAGETITVLTRTSAPACGWDFRQSPRRLVVGGDPAGTGRLSARRCTLYNLNR